MYPFRLVIHHSNIICNGRIETSLQAPLNFQSEHVFLLLKYCWNVTIRREVQVIFENTMLQCASMFIFDK